MREKEVLLAIEFIQFNPECIEDLSKIFDGERLGFFDIYKNLKIRPKKKPVFFSPEYLLLYKDDVLNYARSKKAVMNVINQEQLM